MAFNCADIATLQIDPQVLHNPLNTGVDVYAHAMHSFMNNPPLEYSPATFTVVPAQGDTDAMWWGVSVPWLTL
jgi:hypothetical protein